MMIIDSGIFWSHLVRWRVLVDANHRSADRLHSMKLAALKNIDQAVNSRLRWRSDVINMRRFILNRAILSSSNFATSLSRVLLKL